MTEPSRSILPRWIIRHRALFEASLALLVVVFGVALWMKSHPRSEPTSKTDSQEKRTAPGGSDEPPPNTLRMEALAQRNIGLRNEVAETRTVVQTVRTTGTVGANETRVGHIRALTRGRILKVSVRLGDQVRAGQPLAVYDNIELGEVIGQYGVGLASLKKAQAEAEVARRSVDRAKNLVDLGAVAKAELERRSAEYSNALSSIETQRAELARFEEKMHRFGLNENDIREVRQAGAESHREVSQSTLHAPFSGIVTKLDVVEGETVETDRELFTVADLSIVWVQADIYEKDIGSIRKGVEANVSVDAYPGQTFHGRITYISDILDPKTRTAKVRCEVPNPGGRLKLDMFATIDIPTPAGRQAVMIPAAAVQQINDQPVLFVRANETDFQRRAVQLGAKDGDWVEAVSGVKTGERVVTTGSFQLKSLLLREQIGEKE
ncbi:MAG TPA: efflux RND transporter periplasmic adaptor subunit [Terriglobales bacterium]|nr:efflux RND transporter periplasmic adaptor subunit [Terriglobales bacterium]